MKNKNQNTNWDNFQRNLISSPRCKGCDSECNVLYDAHHEQYFSEECGLVIMEMGCYLIEYKVFDDYFED